MAAAGESGGGSGYGLIALGLALALRGAGAVMLLVLALSHLYVGAYGIALGELAGAAVMGGVFWKSYAPYLDRLERRAPRDRADDAPVAVGAERRRAAEPAPTGVVVAVATAAY